MGRLFGTDGVRGVANIDLTCEMAMDIGRAAAYVLTRQTYEKRPVVLIGKDTRASSDMLEAALAAGMCSVGADVISCGVVPTPAVAYLVRKHKADAGVVISASHNPVEFNGIKIFNSQGFKLADEIEDEVESYVFAQKKEIRIMTHGDVGTVTALQSAKQEYVDFVADSVGRDLSGIKIVMDCANGAASETAHMLFKKLKADCIFIGDNPDRKNVNDGVGSTHLEYLRSQVLAHKADIGVAFDGDADRCLAIDELGGEIDGDEIIAIFAKYLKKNGKLRQDTAVVTVMTNIGFVDFCKKNDIKTVRTSVGDKYVLEEMLHGGYSLGGEQSGHIILTDYSTTGDGQMTAALLLAVLKESGKTSSALSGEIERYPQLLVNVKTTNEGKQRFKEDDVIQGYIEAAQQDLFDIGRVLVRVSGTEPLIRIMVEGRDEAKIAEVARNLEIKIKERV